jgi:hypothetical protein
MVHKTYILCIIYIYTYNSCIYNSYIYVEESYIKCSLPLREKVKSNFVFCSEFY